MGLGQLLGLLSPVNVVHHVIPGEPKRNVTLCVRSRQENRPYMFVRWLFCPAKWLILLKGLSLSFYGNSCCLGGLAKQKSVPNRSLRIGQRSSIAQSSKSKRRRWSSRPEEMENNTSIPHSLQAHVSSGPATANEDATISEENGNSSSFVNQAAIAWNEMRREWIGDRSKKSHRAPKEPIISWCTTYDDLLSTSQRFPQPIPLAEMVDFLVDIWHEEGLYD
uniref:Gag1-like clamp domain-containing protein n=1 Tax=Ananas comosus var. bracteatus TaxID=296719 RepID=A0A6V7QP65_ANACO|nr:unnamed protein product [Ananas comosus var. bracteatus]